MPHAILSYRAVLAIYGEDAHAFLQGLITNDVRKLSPSHALFAALLSPQGKFLFDFFLIEHEGSLLLETDKARAPELKKRLLMYRLRAKVECEERPHLHIVAMWGDNPEPPANGQIVYDDPRLPELGKRMICDSIVSLPMGGEKDYERHRISLGVPEGSKDLIPERSLILEYGYDALHGVDFNKGCYVGQEVTARMKHRATVRKFIYKVQSDTSLPPPGTHIFAEDKEVGEMRSCVGNIGLAHLRIEEAESNGHPLWAAGIALRTELPGWRCVFS